jgi:hypothetical protein
MTYTTSSTWIPQRLLKFHRSKFELLIFIPPVPPEEKFTWASLIKIKWCHPVAQKTVNHFCLFLFAFNSLYASIMPIIYNSKNKPQFHLFISICSYITQAKAL